MVLTIRHTKLRLLKFKDKRNLEIYIKKFNNIFQANKKTLDEDKLALFSVTLKKMALE